ncbi:MAG: DUF1624 domain-containing protein [Oscillospiraceae bacterium]|nr:DUF1624 domain-containing protein [Oscillospiraceae bacterium]
MNGRERIQSIDALRGLCVVLMCAHHLLYDCTVNLNAPWSWFSNPVFDALHYVFAGLFIMLSGVSSRFSRSNVKRGIKVLICAAAVSGVSMLIGSPILFGVLHFLGLAMVFYGLTGKLLEKLPGPVLPVICVLLTAASAGLVSGKPTQLRWLWPLGFTYPGFFSADYFPILPWIFVFLFGTWLGAVIKEGRMPKRFYTLSPPLLPQIGRKALLIYMLHQPVLYGVTFLAGKLAGTV